MSLARYHLADKRLKNEKGIKNAPVPFFIKPFTRTIAGMLETAYLNHNYESHLSFLESELEARQSPATSTDSKSSFICGPSLTAADFMMIFPLEAAHQIAGLTETRYPYLTAYIKAIQQRDAYKRAIERIVKETGSYDPNI